MSVDLFLQEVARVQIPEGGQSYLSTEKAQSAPPGPPLQAGQKNRIVIYCGASNPPHKGHIACLVDALQHMVNDPDLCGFVACIVVPLDEEALLQKQQKDKNNTLAASAGRPPLILSAKDRADLLSSYIHSPASGLDAQLRARVHVWVPARARTLTDIPRLLAAEAKTKGFEVDFVVLRSCEYLYHGDKGAARHPRAIHPRCSMVIFTNTGGRTNESIWQCDGSLRPLGPPWSKWEPVVVDEDLGEGVRRIVWSTNSPDSEQRMLDTRNTLESEPSFSSTQIRKILYDGSFEQRERLEKYLREAGAINPARLILMLEDWARQNGTI